MRRWLSGLALLLLTSGPPAIAHHPFAAEFDWKKPVTITGTVTRFEWENPHSMIFVKGRDDSGTEDDWMVELAGPGRLSQLGWHSRELKSGDRVSVEGWLAKSGSKELSAKSVTVNGRQMAGGSSFFEEGKAPSPTTRQASAAHD